MAVDGFPGTVRRRRPAYANVPDAPTECDRCGEVVRRDRTQRERQTGLRVCTACLDEPTIRVFKEYPTLPIPDPRPPTMPELPDPAPTPRYMTDRDFRNR